MIRESDVRRFFYTICFIRRGNSLLLIERVRAPNRGLWNGVGGKLEDGETPLQGVLREVREETGLTLEAVRFAGTVRWVVDGADRGGMYAFVASLPENFEYPAPCDTDEGVLEWKEIHWVVAADNEQVAVSARHFLPIMLESCACYEHRFTFEKDMLSSYSRDVLPADETGCLPISDGDAADIGASSAGG